MSYRAVVFAWIATVMVSPVLAASDSAGKAPAAPATQSGAPPSSAMPAQHGSLSAGTGTKTATKAPPKPTKKVDLNNASLAELKTLPTVGDAEAKKIVANRPYKSKGELMTKAGLPEGVYQAVRHHVELQTPRKSSSAKTGEPKKSAAPKSETPKAETKQ